MMWPGVESEVIAAQERAEDHREQEDRRMDQRRYFEDAHYSLKPVPGPLTGRDLDG